MIGSKTPLATSGAGNVQVFPSASTSTFASGFYISNEGTVPGFLSPDNGENWLRVPVGAFVIPGTCTNLQNVLLCRDGDTDMTSVYISALA